MLLMLASCANPQPISTNPLQTLPGGATVQQGLIDASYNLHSAMAIGVLQPDDPAASCVDGVLHDIGIDPSTGQATGGGSFTPRTSDLISAGSVAYILAQQAAASINGNISLPVGCQALIGKLVIDAARLARQIPGGMVFGLPLVPFTPHPSSVAPVPAPAPAPQKAQRPKPVASPTLGAWVCNPMCRHNEMVAGQ